MTYQAYPDPDAQAAIPDDDPGAGPASDRAGQAVPRAERARGGSISARLVALVLAVSFASAVLSSATTATMLRSPGGVAFSLAGAEAAAGTRSGTAPGVGAGVASDQGFIVSVAQAATSAVVTIDTIDSTGLGLLGTSGGTGSGFVFDANGLILTNDHVVEGATAIRITFLDGRHFSGTVVASDADLDLAVVRINATGLPSVTLGPDAPLAVGETLIAIGSPLGTYTGSVTSGILSATGRTITVSDEITGRPHDLNGLLQTDAAINPGNSGGPILDASGVVVGIATATSTRAAGLGFAIPIGAAAAIIARARGSAT